jgi:hypothetical protein
MTFYDAKQPNPSINAAMTVQVPHAIAIEAHAIPRPSQITLILHTESGHVAYALTPEQTEQLRERLGC